ncbi:hypothetical protein PGT21_011365 [Puccinia graminis f. sp. tritici]|uniref:Uncharacterized protein n=1 Tax=Puccinia graminis f. sp. tritici TaxID=56615 RepID=A0A5B0NBS2_PUCGR|nr:hypothetical protein PGT21_011365 [Puccinia graminis f. sp. tritici]KAA1129209.1 hypothetical protein PGTUg99_012968 [Puccinia graminis f. sp. tritici]
MRPRSTAVVKQARGRQSTGSVLRSDWSDQTRRDSSDLQSPALGFIRAELPQSQTSTGPPTLDRKVPAVSHQHLPTRARSEHASSRSRSENRLVPSLTSATEYQAS